MFLPYRGHATDTYTKKLTNIGALTRPIITTSKVKDVLPTLKAKIPKEFHFVESLPRNASGKILKRVIKEEVDNNQLKVL